jgi:cytochrome c553
VKGSVARALKTELSDSDRQALLEFAQTLPAEDPSEAEPDSNDLPAQEGNR